MKKITLSLLLAALMISNTNRSSADLFTSENYFYSSNNYKEKFINQDLSETIYIPMFSNPTGEGSMRISASSDANGICKLFGYEKYVESSKIRRYGNFRTTVIIGKNGQFSKFSSGKKSFVMSSLACYPFRSGSIPVSENYSGKFLNDDESTTIKLPKFKFSGSNIPFSGESDSNGVCKLYGFKKAVENSIQYTSGGVTSPYAFMNVVLNKESRFSRYCFRCEDFMIGSIICR